MAPGASPEASRQKRKTKQDPKPLPRIEAANSLSIADLQQLYLRNDDPCLAYEAGPITYHVTLETSSTITAEDFRQCFSLIEATSADTYKASRIGWSPKAKKKEMKLVDLRYLLVRRSSSLSSTTPTAGDTTTTTETVANEIDAFLSFMLTYEDGYEVIYCYEIHLSESSRGCGLGKHLMGVMERVGREVGVSKSMLTVFLENEGAVRFYERLGYGVDEFSPEPRRVRGRVIRPDYVILSKSLGGHASHG